MKTTKEMIEVMQAYERGEQIQVKTTNKKCDWEDVKEPYWQWNFCDYRVKPKPNKMYVPFDTADEFLREQEKRNTDLVIYCGKLCYAYTNYLKIVILDRYSAETITMLSYFEFFKTCKFSDGTPCGKEVEE